MKYLVDSSAWIEYFKGSHEYSFLDDLISTNVICTNDIILSELLPSIVFRKEHKLAALLSAVKNYSLTIQWQEIRDIQLLSLKNGHNNIGISDIIIAQNCMQNELRIIGHDKHFSTMATYIPLEVH